MSEFIEFPKLARWSREIVITEKIDGTNAQVVIAPWHEASDYGLTEASPVLAEVDGCAILAGSRNRYLTREKDNFGFAKYVEENAKGLALLGPGRHYGEWWGSGIQRGYGLPKGEKRFSLFNVSRWGDLANRVEGSGGPPCGVVPTLYVGPNTEEAITRVLTVLREQGSRAAPFMNPEGIVIFHTASRTLYKKTLDNDESPKSLVKVA